MENKNTLAKIALAINVVLIILIVILFSKIGKGDTTEPVVKLSDSTETVDIPVATTGKYAFFNMDTLTANLLLYAEIEKEIEAAAKAAEQKMRNKQKDIDNWKAKWENKGTLMSAEQAQYAKEANKIQNEAMQFEQNVQIKLQQEQEDYMKTLVLRISNFSKNYAKENGYDAIFSYQFGQSPWYYNKSLDITKEIVELMNADFKASTGLEDGE
jgi:outer membrane protein